MANIGDTSTYEGDWNGRKSVAIKRFSDKDKACIEAMKYKKCDKGLHIVSLHGEEISENHVELILEKADCTLGELIKSYFWQTTQSGKKGDFLKMVRDKKLLWDQDCGRPSIQLLQIIKDIVNAVAYLFCKGEVHHNIGPNNVLIFDENGALRAKLSLSLGTLGWKAPKPKRHSDQENLLFGLGLLVYFCVSEGGHPFGDINNLALCQQNIDNNQMNLESRKTGKFLWEESRHLITHLLKPVANDRLDLPSIRRHPFFWNINKKLSFFTELNLKLNSTATKSELYQLNQNKYDWKLDTLWNARLPKKLQEFISDGDKSGYKKWDVKYDPFFLKDLVRLIRNSFNHREELKDLAGGTSLHEIDKYYALHFDEFFMNIHGFVHRLWKNDEALKDFFEAQM